MTGLAGSVSRAMTRRRGYIANVSLWFKTVCLVLVVRGSNRKKSHRLLWSRKFSSPWSPTGSDTDTPLRIAGCAEAVSSSEMERRRVFQRCDGSEGSGDGVSSARAQPDHLDRHLVKMLVRQPPLLPKREKGFNGNVPQLFIG